MKNHITPSDIQRIIENSYKSYYFFNYSINLEILINELFAAEDSPDVGISFRELNKEICVIGNQVLKNPEELDNYGIETQKILKLMLNNSQ